MKIKKYDLKIISQDDINKKYEIVGLKEGRSIYGQPTSGGCGMIKNANHPGYVTLMYVYHKFDHDDHTYHVDFYPMYDEEGNQIVVKFNHDVLFAILSNNREYINNGKTIDTCMLSIPRYGVVTDYKDHVEHSSIWSSD